MKIKNVTLMNTISNLVLQIVTMASAFVVPKIILEYFGSETNGLISSLNQFLNYISLLEGGVMGVVMANLYKPLYEKDYNTLSSVVKTSDKFLKKIAFVFVIYTMILAVIYPIISNSTFSYTYIFSLVLILSINLFMQYCFSLNMKILLNADKKIYITSFVQAGFVLINIILTIVSVKIYPDIHFLKILTSINYFLLPLIYKHYIKKYYKINKKAEVSKDLLKSRWDGLAINIAYFIHANTDIAILTTFTDLKTVSIYSVYKLIANGINQIINSISSAFAPNIGHLYASGDKTELSKKFDIYEFIIFFLVFVLYVIAGLLITPFVMIYTSNITDTNYYQPIFGILILMGEAMYLLKAPHVNLAYSANKFKELTTPAYIEAILNIIISIILVSQFGLIGVAIGTLVAMTYRTIYQVVFLKKQIINRSIWIFFKKFLLFIIIGVISILICINILPTVQYTLSDWIVHAIIYTIITLLLYGLGCLLFYKKEIKSIIIYLKKR